MSLLLRQEPKLKSGLKITLTGIGIVGGGYALSKFIPILLDRLVPSSITDNTTVAEPSPNVTTEPDMGSVDGGGGGTISTPPLVQIHPELPPVVATPVPSPTAEPSPGTAIVTNTDTGESHQVAVTDLVPAIRQVSQPPPESYNNAPAAGVTQGGAGSGQGGYNRIKVYNGATGQYQYINVTTPSGTTAKGTPEYASTNYAGQIAAAKDIVSVVTNNSDYLKFSGETSVSPTVPLTGAEQILYNAEKGLVPSETNPGETSSPGVLNASVLAGEGALSPRLTAEEITGQGNTENFDPYSVSKSYTDVTALLAKGLTPTQIRAMGY